MENMRNLDVKSSLDEIKQLLKDGGAFEKKVQIKFDQLCQNVDNHPILKQNLSDLLETLQERQSESALNEKIDFVLQKSEDAKSVLRKLKMCDKVDD